MKKSMRWSLLFCGWVLLFGSLPSLLLGKPLRIGVTLHPYYSWTSQVVGEHMEVVPLLPAEMDPHSYQPRPEEIRVVSELDVLVVNGLGHDAFVRPLLQAADHPGLILLDPAQGLPVLPAAHGEEETTPNSHSFLALLGAVPQIQNLARQLGELEPEHAREFQQNARTYSRRLRQILAQALRRLEMVPVGAVKVATVHDGYGYLFAELGLEVQAVVQPRHGIAPSARQLADTIRRIQEAEVQVLFLEMELEPGFAAIIQEETGCRLAKLSHISRGAYTPERFEQEMTRNLEQIVQAVLEAWRQQNPPAILVEEGEKPGKRAGE